MKPGNEAVSFEFGFLRGALFPMKHIQVSLGSRRFHIDDARRSLIPRGERALRQVENLARFSQNASMCDIRFWRGKARSGRRDDYKA